MSGSSSSLEEEEEGEEWAANATEDDALIMRKKSPTLKCPDNPLSGTKFLREKWPQMVLTPWLSDDHCAR